MTASVPIGHPPIARDATADVIAFKVNRLLLGEINCVQANVTLRANQSTTTLTDGRIQTNSFITMMPLTANAATAFVAGIWFSNFVASNAKTVGTCTINHASSAHTDQTFNVLIIG